MHMHAKANNTKQRLHDQVDLGDKTGEISATFFGRAVDKYYSLLKPEKASQPVSSALGFLSR